MHVFQVPTLPLGWSGDSEVTIVDVLIRAFGDVRRREASTDCSSVTLIRQSNTPSTTGPHRMHESHEPVVQDPAHRAPVGEPARAGYSVGTKHRTETHINRGFASVYLLYTQERVSFGSSSSACATVAADSWPDKREPKWPCAPTWPCTSRPHRPRHRSHNLHPALAGLSAVHPPAPHACVSRGMFSADIPNPTTPRHRERWVRPSDVLSRVVCPQLATVAFPCDA